MPDRVGERTLSRPRVDALLADAVRRPLSVVCAGSGYGKTCAVQSFTQDLPRKVIWARFSERDNDGSRFWTKYLQILREWNERLARRCESLGFPGTEDALNQHIPLRRRYNADLTGLIVLDDVHLLEHPDVLRFLEWSLRDIPAGTSVVLIGQELPELGLRGRQLRSLIPTVTEEDLRFTEEEVRRYLREEGLSVPAADAHDIWKDTRGWAFAVGLIARSLKRAPGYAGYVRGAMRHNVFKLMENEVFDQAPEKLRRLLVRLSLIDHLSAELIEELAEGDPDLPAELRRLSAYLRLDGATNAYSIHHLFLEFLRGRQGSLTEREIAQTYRVAARWCGGNGFVTDALRYYGRVGDYAPAVGLICAQPVQMPQDVALCAMELLRRAPAGTADAVPRFAVAHVRLAVRLGLWEEAQTLLDGYERHWLAQADGPAGDRTLGMLYYSGGYLRALRCAYGDGCDFDGYYAKMARCLEQDPLPRDQYADMPIGFWASLAGSARRGAPEEYCRAAARAAADLARCYSGAAAGIDLLCRGELLFYQGEMRAAEPYFRETLCRAAENRQYEIEHKAQFYLMRMALGQGRRGAAERLLQGMEGRLDTGGYDHRFFNYDAAQAWYFCALRKPEAIPSWLKEDFAPYGHAYYVENLGNQLKARYHFLTRSADPLLRYAEQMRRRESVLYGRVEILALAACALAQSGEQDAAFATLREVYETAAPNGIVAPLQELGRDMRTLCAAALRGRVPGIPAEWLERTRRQASSFAKVQSLMIAEYERTQVGGRPVRLSAREGAILGDLYRGLSRAEIAEQQGLSVNTVNSVISILFQKLGAHSIVDAVRIAAEEKLV